ncbi:Metallo-dependent phosphatase [Wallemia mellicola]|uniref:Metallo-dependent phosphatase n=1 Tax=Wallemia mellicola TaxID=1708541 RepID=A0AB74KGA0_9BASI|nr:Metallo-dependent phosphatase [Wallemia mellicola]
MSSLIKKSIIPLLAISSAYLYLKPTNPALLESDVLLDGYKVLSQQRIVAIDLDPNTGDLHGDYQRTLDGLRVTQLIDENDNWIGNKTVLVQTGDITDRGADMVPIYQFLEKLRVQAAEVGGSLHTILGNHDIMQPMRDWRYVHPTEMKYFNGDLTQREQAFSKDGWIGKLWLKDYLTTVNIPHYSENDGQKYNLPANLSTQFVHAGIHPSFAYKELNDDGKRWLEKLTNGDRNWSDVEKSLWSPNGPYWFRGAALDNETKACAMAKEVMQTIGAKRIVQGHTPNFDNIVSRCNGGIILIDTGMSKAYGGIVSALEINGYILSKDDKHYFREIVKALYQNRSVTLVDETNSL